MKSMTRIPSGGEEEKEEKEEEEEEKRDEGAEGGEEPWREAARERHGHG